MSPGRASLKGFLATARNALLVPPVQRHKPLTFVVGNESADLDSLCSALLLAYFRTHTPPHTLHIPLSNLTRADLALRPELTAVLHPSGLKPDDLITLSDLPQEEDLSPSDTRWLLVDHNVLTGDLAARFPSPIIIGCIDHHEDEGVVPLALPPGQPRVFAKCGSCMSLVVEQCKSTWDQLTSEGGPTCSDSTPAAECDAALARVALAPILIDTANLTSKDKTTERDVSAVRVAESKLLLSSSSSSPWGGGGGGYERGKFYGGLTRLKEQIAGMSYRDVLRKDYKRWSEGSLSLGVSSVVQGFEYVIEEVGDKEQAAFLSALRDWAAEQELDIVAVMTVSRPGGAFTRELLVWGLNEEGAKAVREFDLKYRSTLGLESWRGGELDGGNIQGKEGLRVCWTQRAVENSRKQVAPMLRAAMRESSRL